MIDKLIGQLSTEVIDFFQKYNLPTTAQYTPELEAVVEYSRTFLTKHLSTSSVQMDGSKYYNKLLYKVATPKLAEYAAHNNPFTILKGFEELSQNYVMEKVDDTISKIRQPAVGENQLDNGKVKSRDMSLMEISVDFLFISESQQNIFAIILLFYQRLSLMNLIELPLDLFDDGQTTVIDYLMSWDTNSLELSYANFNSGNALNTVSFNVKISGPLFSEFYTEQHIIDRYDLTFKIQGLTE